MQEAFGQHIEHSVQRNDIQIETGGTIDGAVHTLGASMNIPHAGCDVKGFYLHTTEFGTYPGYLDVIYLSTSVYDDGQYGECQKYQPNPTHAAYHRMETIVCQSILHIAVHIYLVRVVQVPAPLH